LFSLSSDTTERDGGSKRLKAGYGVLKINAVAGGKGKAGGGFGFQTVMMCGRRQPMAGWLVEGPGLGGDGAVLP
jgi:hypothetical protein